MLMGLIVSLLQAKIGHILLQSVSYLSYTFAIGNISVSPIHYHV